ncbi:MAG: hypothetical protein CBD98_004050 [Flavobacteriaceae bacterium TMED238]|nr:MAG: hypothetical protein CBD98_004050 [Flavobacteriaceae bacterium TMED238]
MPDNIGFDLDTSIIIQSNQNKTILFNNVDTPINLKILKKINSYIKKDFKKNIDIFCCALGAASEFPQCFLNINRNKEKNKIINRSLNNLEQYLKYLKPKVFFPAGGAYAIYGKFYELNKYIAQPKISQITKKTNFLKTRICNLIGGGSIKFEKSKYIINEINHEKKKDFKTKFLNQIKKLSYYYSKKKVNINLKNLDGIFIKAKRNYLKILEHKKIDTKWNINFKIYKNFELNKNCYIDKKNSKFLKTYRLRNYKQESKNNLKLECYIEYQLFKSLLDGKFPWNTSLSGSTIMYKRNPNKFNIDMVFSLNFLRI